ncbi:MAG: hypothetical protein IV090_14715 [Candidatus Sericytochromatia bacterium]|nr:hypothetical protein [Candidatus Sericytochromatia bacterium]
MSEQATKIRSELAKLKGQQKWMTKLQWLLGAMLLLFITKSYLPTGKNPTDSDLFPILCLCVGWLGMLTQSFHSSTTTLSNIILEQLEDVV